MNRTSQKFMFLCFIAYGIVFFLQKNIVNISHLFSFNYVSQIIINYKQFNEKLYIVNSKPSHFYR